MGNFNRWGNHDTTESTATIPFLGPRSCKFRGVHLGGTTQPQEFAGKRGSRLSDDIVENEWEAYTGSETRQSYRER